MTPDYQHLIGRPFKWGKRDCIGLLISFYKDVFDIDIPNYARPDDFYKKDLNLFNNLYRDAGFYVLNCHPAEYQFGDVVFSAIQSEFSNHCSIMVENNQILHHLYGRLSNVESYKGLTRNTATGVYRHKDVDLNQVQMLEKRDILDFLSPTMRKRLDGLRSSNPSTA